MRPWERQRAVLGMENQEAPSSTTPVPVPETPPTPVPPISPTPGGVPRTGQVMGKYAGQPCIVCGTTIPARRPRWTIGSMLLRGQYCTQACWQVGQKPVTRTAHDPPQSGRAPGARP